MITPDRLDNRKPDCMHIADVDRTRNFVQAGAALPLSPDRIELEAQLGQTSHLPGRFVRVMTCVRRAMRLLTNRDIGRPIEDAVERDSVVR
jgi:hypothetical protein